MILDSHPNCFSMLIFQQNPSLFFNPQTSLGKIIMSYLPQMTQRLFSNEPLYPFLDAGKVDVCCEVPILFDFCTWPGISSRPRGSISQKLVPKVPMNTSLPWLGKLVGPVVEKKNAKLLANIWYLLVSLKVEQIKVSSVNWPMDLSLNL